MNENQNVYLLTLHVAAPLDIPSINPTNLFSKQYHVLYYCFIEMFIPMPPVNCNAKSIHLVH